MVRAVLIDTHCHLDQYADPFAIVRSLDSVALMMVAVTTTPSAFGRLRHRFGGERHLRLALGIHPLHAGMLPDFEWRLFNHYLPETKYVGEVGLDFSPQGSGSRVEQEQAFRRVLQAATGHNKVLSIHSRRAEARVLDLLNEFDAEPAIFHWYSGSLGVLDHIIEVGHYCSLNPAMVRSEHGRQIIDRVPRSRVLVETDGPYVRIGNRPATPADANIVYQYLAKRWAQSTTTVVDHIYSNFIALLEGVKKPGSLDA
jgi:TatD DNase family protein